MNRERKLVLVTGATGWIGRNVCRELQEQGCAVVAYSQNPASGPWSKAYVGGLKALRNPPADLLALLGETKIVIHCAGRAHRPMETREEKVVMEEVNVGGTRDLIEACRRTGVGRLVYVSTIAAYDWTQTPPQGVAETGIFGPLTTYARTKLQGEQLICSSGLDWRVARLSTVFGNGDKANFAKLAHGMKKKRFFVPGTGCARKSVIPVELAAEVLVRLAGEDSPRHRLINVALSHGPTLREMCDAFSQTCGFDRAPSLPLSFMRGGALVGSVISGLWPGCPLTISRLNKLVTSTVVDNRCLRENFPDLPMMDFRDALGSSAGYYRNI